MARPVTKIEGIPLSRLYKEFGLAVNTVKSLIKQGDLKLNDHDRIDEEYYMRFKEEWLKKPEWMRRGKSK